MLTSRFTAPKETFNRTRRDHRVGNIENAVGIVVLVIRVVRKAGAQRRERESRTHSCWSRLFDRRRIRSSQGLRLPLLTISLLTPPSYPGSPIAYATLLWRPAMRAVAGRRGSRGNKQRSGRGCPAVGRCDGHLLRPA